MVVTGVREILVDSNVILDVATEDAQWIEWSAGQLETLSEDHILVINPIVYGEVSVGFDRIEDLEEALPPELFRREVYPGKRRSSPEGASCGTVGRGARSARHCRTSTSGLTPPSWGSLS